MVWRYKASSCIKESSQDYYYVLELRTERVPLRDEVDHHRKRVRLCRYRDPSKWAQQLIPHANASETAAWVDAAWNRTGVALEYAFSGFPKTIRIPNGNPQTSPPPGYNAISIEFFGVSQINLLQTLAINKTFVEVCLSTRVNINARGLRLHTFCACTRLHCVCLFSNPAVVCSLLGTFDARNLEITRFHFVHPTPIATVYNNMLLLLSTHQKVSIRSPTELYLCLAPTCVRCIRTLATTARFSM